MWVDEVRPVFAADGMGEAADRYLASVRERFANPFLRHRIADIAANHEAKKARRLAPVRDRGRALGLAARQPRLAGALGD